MTRVDRPGPVAGPVLGFWAADLERACADGEIAVTAYCRRQPPLNLSAVLKALSVLGRPPVPTALFWALAVNPWTPTPQASGSMRALHLPASSPGRYVKLDLNQHGK